MKKGFTMIELIFVIVILGILAAVAIPKLAATREDASATAAIATWKTAIGQVQATTLATGAIPDFTTVVDASANMTVANGVITATAGDTDNTTCAIGTLNGNDLDISGVTFGVTGCSLFEGLSTVSIPLLGAGVTR